MSISCFSQRERERERERETPVTSIDITLKSRVIMHMITSTACRPCASTRFEPVEYSSACKKGAVKKIAPTATKKKIFVAVGAIFFHRPLM